MKIKPHRPDLGQSYSNPFKEKRIYPFNKIGRVVVEKTTGDILLWLGENDSRLTLEGAPWTYNENLHDIMVHFPAFYYKRNWNGDILEDSILTDLPKDVISDKVGYEIFPIFVRDDGSIRPYVLYGAFKGVELGGQLRSVVGYKPTVNKTISAFRDLARQGRDSRWNIETFGIISMVQFLYKIAFQDLDSQKILGNGWTNKTASAITGSTMGLGNRCGFLDPFENSPDKPHDSIVMSFQIVDGELVFYNKKDSDPMPIKTTNMAGLQKWEETEDYTIYLCKDATMTTVQRYVAGTFQEFQERKALIDSSQELMRSYTIEWTDQDSINLINEINDVALTKLEQSVMMLPVDSEEFVNEIPVLLPRAVPVTYECCFRVDKKSGEIYIGEGYENLFTNFSVYSSDLFEVTRAENDIGIVWKGPSGRNSFNIGSTNLAMNINDNISVNFKTNTPSSCINSIVTAPSNTVYNSLSFTTTVADSVIRPRANNFNFTENYTENISNFQITKTTNSKPFVKSVMPSGKLAFVTNGSMENYSSIVKGVKRLSGASTGAQIIRFGRYSLEGFRAIGVAEDVWQGGTNVVSPNAIILDKTAQTSNILLTRTDDFKNEFLTQLLVYKSNMTETELKAENSKVIKATDNQSTSLEYPANGNQISLFGIEDFYGNIWSFADGFFVKDDGYYITNSPNKMGVLSEHTHYPATPLMGVSDGQNIGGYFKTIEKGLGVYNIPNLLGSSNSKNYTDYFWSHKKNRLNTCRFGGMHTDSLATGCFYINAITETKDVGVTTGARLTFLP